MRVGSVSGVSVNASMRNRVLRQKNEGGADSTQSDVNFKGKFGQIVGGTLGTSAVVAASILAAPAIICLTGAGLVAGAVACDIAEDKINQHFSDDDNNQ